MKEYNTSRGKSGFEGIHFSGKIHFSVQNFCCLRRKKFWVATFRMGKTRAGKKMKHYPRPPRLGTDIPFYGKLGSLFVFFFFLCGLFKDGNKCEEINWESGESTLLNLKLCLFKLCFYSGLLLIDCLNSAFIHGKVEVLVNFLYLFGCGQYAHGGV